MEELTSCQARYLQPAIGDLGLLSKRFKHFSLHKSPETLQGFVDLFLTEDGETFDRMRLVWVRPDSYLTLGGICGGHEFCYSIVLVDDEFGIGKGYLSLQVLSETERGALLILKMLFDTNDDLYNQIKIHAGTPHERGHLPLFDDQLLEAIVCQNPTRQIQFTNIEFQPENGRVLATRGEGTRLRFHVCAFVDDGGASFAQALQVRPDESVGPARLEFITSFPEALIDNWGHYPNSSLDLSFALIDFNVRQGRALASAQIRNLRLHHCQFEDGGQAIVDSVRAGRGPKGLILDYTQPDCQPFDTAQRCLSFLTALQGNQHLEVLKLRCQHIHDVACAKALAAALRQNTTLIHLGFAFSEFVARDSWSSIFNAITDHPALCILNLGNMIEWGHADDLTPTLVAMTRKNNILEEIEYSPDFVRRSMIDPKVFHLRVVPELECNQLRKRLVGIRNVTSLSEKAGIIAKALARVNDKPSLIYMLLRPNMDSLVIASPGSRKRNRC